MKKLLLVLFLMSVFTITAFGLSGTYSPNDLFYKPGYASYGTDEFAEYETYIDIADVQITANQVASGDENICDVSGAMWTGNTETFITVTYQDADNTVDAVVPVKDEDDMASDSATFLCTQQSIKAYADTLHALQYLKTEMDSESELEGILSDVDDIFTDTSMKFIDVSQYAGDDIGARINAAITAGEKYLFVPPGTYDQTTKIENTTANVFLWSTGSGIRGNCGATIKKQSDIISLESSAVINIKGINFDGSDVADVDDSTAGVVLHYKSVFIGTSSYHGGNGLELTVTDAAHNCNGMIVEGRFSNNEDSGIHIEDSNDAASPDTNIIQIRYAICRNNGDAGLKMLTGYYNHVYGQFDLNDYGIYVSDNSGNSGLDKNVFDVYCETNTTNDVYFATTDSANKIEGRISTKSISSDNMFWSSPRTIEGAANDTKLVVLNLRNSFDTGANEGSGFRFTQDDATRHSYIYGCGDGDLDLVPGSIAGGSVKAGDGTWTNYINITNVGVLTTEGTATIDGVGAGNLVDKSAVETITGNWVNTDNPWADNEVSDDITITAADTTDATCFVALWETITGAQKVKSDAALLYDASTGMLSATNVLFGKFDATQAPTVNNDVDEGYVVGSKWYDVTSDNAYTCLDNTDGAAVWSKFAPSGGTGWVDTSGTPVQYDIPRFTDADTVEGRSYSETRNDLENYVLYPQDYTDGNGDGTVGDPWAGACIEDAVNAVPSGGTIYLRQGYYQMTSYADVDTPMTIIGAGMGSTFVVTADNHGFSIYEAGGVSYVTIRDMTIDGTAQTDNTYKACISAGTATYVLLENLEVKNAGKYGIDLNPVSYFVLQNIYAHDNYRHGIHNGTDTSGTNMYNVFQDIYAWDNGLTGDTGVSGLDDRGNTTYPNEDSYNLYDNIHCWGNQAGGLSICDQHNIAISNCSASDNGTYGFNLRRIDESNISNCYAELSGDEGVYLIDSNNINFVNIISRNNNVDESTYAGMMISGGDNIRLTACRFFDDRSPKLQTYGLKTAGTADNIEIVNCNFSGNLTGNISEGGSGDIISASIEDSDFRIGDGVWTNYVEVSTAGVMTFVGTADVDLPDDSVDSGDINFNFATSSSEGGEATTFNCTDNENEALACPILFVDGATGSQGAETDGDLHYNPSTGLLTATGFAGALTGNVTGDASGSSGSCTGNAATCTTASAGDAAVDFFGAGVDAVTDATTCTDIEGTLLSIGGTTLNAAIPADHITYDMMQDATATDKILGRSTAGAGTIEEIACTAFARSILDDADEATFKATVNLEIGTDVEVDLSNEAGLYAVLSDVSDFLQNTVEDTSPGLGGELDAGAHTIGFTLGTATGDGATLINWTTGNKFKFTFGAQNETITFTNPSNPCNVALIIVQDATGSRTITWSGMTIKWAGGTAPTLTTAANGEDVVSFIWDGTSYYGAATLAFATP